MQLPNLLATRRGRLTAFFLLYLTEGIPLGFVATAVATQMRRMGVGPAEIGVMVASFYLPWAFKWAVGPVVDVFRSRRFGHRRAWIMAMQLLMALTVLAMAGVPLPGNMGFFIALLLVHNAFGATQDVAIDALAVNSLGADERGFANGLMFAGAQIGQAVGGAGVLFVAGFTGFAASYVLVPLAILSVTVLVVLPMKEAVQAPAASGGGWKQALADMRDFVRESLRSFLGSRSALAGVAYALLPNGAMALSLALQTNLAVELGMNDDQVAALALVSTVIGAGGMVAGGYLSDKLGRRRTLAVFLALMSVPTLYMFWVLHRAGYVMPRAPGGAPLPDLIWHLWAACIAYNLAMGLMYGPRTAVFMDITNPRVAATQFTAYMAMLNVGIAFAATWQGIAVEAFGYPLTLLADALVGLVSIALLPLLKGTGVGFGACDEHAERRARTAAAGLALACAAFAPWWLLHDPKGPMAGIVGTLFTLAFVCSALFLFAGTLLQELPRGWQLGCRWGALVLLALYLRRFIPAGASGTDSAAVIEVLRAALALVALAGAALLWRVSRAPWPGLLDAATPQVQQAPAPAPAPAAAPGPAPAAGRESAAG